MPVKKAKDPLLGAAVLKMSFRLRGEENSAAYRFLYEGLLRDLKLTDAQVDEYLKANLEKVQKAVRGLERGGGRSGTADE
jgi:hypothetical protein